MVLGHWQSNPRGPARSGDSTCSEPPCRTPEQVSSLPSQGGEQRAITDRRRVPPVPSRAQRPVNAGLRADLLHAFLAKATWKAGTADWRDDTEGAGRGSSSRSLGPKSLPPS